MTGQRTGAGIRQEERSFLERSEERYGDVRNGLFEIRKNYTAGSGEARRDGLFDNVKCTSRRCRRGILEKGARRAEMRATLERGERRAEIVACSSISLSSSSLDERSGLLFMLKLSPNTTQQLSSILQHERLPTRRST